MINKPLKITVNIATYNESNNIDTILSSIYRQNYPKDYLEVLIVDGKSTDDTVKKASKYPVNIINNEKRDGASGRMLGLLNASGDVHIYLDADMELPKTNEWFNKMIYPFTQDDRIVGSFTRFIPNPFDSALNRCLSYNEFQHDPLMEFLSPNLSDTIIEEKKEYKLTFFNPGKVPIVGVIMFRTDILRNILKEINTRWKNWMWSDVDFPIICAEKGLNYFAYVADAGLYHYSYPSVAVLLKKKRRDLYWSYLSTINRRANTYIDFESKRDIIKLLLWVIYANLILPSLFKGIIKSIKNKDLSCMYIPLLTVIVTDYVIYLLLIENRGRKLIWNLIKNIF